MSSGRFIVVEKDLRDRDAWLTRNAEAVKPYLSNERDCWICVFSLEDVGDRATSRIGGLPFWPKEIPWPICNSCEEPLAFMAQLDFRRFRVSHKLPHDVITFHYCTYCQPQNNVKGKGEALVSWHDFRSDLELIEPESIPVGVVNDHGPAYGEFLQAVDFPTPNEAYGGSIVQGDEYTYLQFTLQGTKFGGYPPPVQRIGTPVDANKNPMRFLGTIGSFKSRSLRRGRSESVSCGDLVWGDMGCVFLWISDASTSHDISWFIASY